MRQLRMRRRLGERQPWGVRWLRRRVGCVGGRRGSTEARDLVWRRRSVSTTWPYRGCGYATREALRRIASGWTSNVRGVCRRTTAWGRKLCLHVWGYG